MTPEDKKWWKCVISRAVRTFPQVLVSTIPAGFVITPAMIEHFNISYVYIILAWIATALLGSFTSVVTSMIVGVPEADKPRAEDHSPIFYEDDEDGEE